MKATSLCLIAVSFTATACAQAIMEHAAAAAGATVGTIGGKVLSSGIDNVLGKAAETGSTTAKKTEEAKPEKQAKQASAGSETAPAASGFRRSPKTTRAAAADKPVFATMDRAIPTPVAAIAPPAPTFEDLAKVKEGESLDDVFASLGKPSSHITIPDEGHLVEILSYSNGAERIGTIRADNGQVVSFTPVR